MTAHISPAAARFANASLYVPTADTSVLPFHTDHQMLMVQANAEIYGQGEKATALYQVAFGAVRLYRLLTDGRRQISAFYVAGETFGFEADLRHHFFAEAICSSAIRVFREPLGGDTERAILPVALAALVRTQEHLLVVGRQSASERVAAFLLDMMERQGGLPNIELVMSRSDIADYLGLTIETVSRTFSRFRRCQCIRLTSARAITIARPDKLRTLCE